MKKFSPGIGSASLILIFSALCLAIFALLSLSSANREKALTEKFVSSTENYYAADSAAVEIAAQLRSAVSRGECPNKINDVNITTDGISSFAYLCPIDAQRALSVRLEITETTLSVLSWCEISTTDWVPEDGLNVWKGD